ncbi:hypothetical protein COD66_12630 [Bacillus cereus]|nr:hypothetical protein COD66_12630 [Bacillus cereus]
MKEEILKKVIDTILDEFNNNSNVLVEDMPNFSSNYYRYHSESTKTWNDNQRCMYKGCKSLTIAGSHTIQKSGPLKVIADDNFVYHPNLYKGEIKMANKHIGVASTFPGFCSEHESIFSVFEKKKEICEEADVRLQVFRTICRQIYSLEHGVRNYPDMKENYSDIKKTYFRNKLVEKGVERDVEIHVQTLMNMSMDTRMNVTSTINQTVKAALGQARSLYDNMIKDIKEERSSRIHNYSIKIDKTFPVTLSGFGNLYVTKGSAIDYVPLVLNIIPSEDDTVLIMSGPIRYKRFIDNYMKYNMQNELFIICMIEQWMLYGSDHWFIKPSVWKGLGNVEQDLILSEMFNLTKDINSPASVSIFNELKSKLIYQVENEIGINELPYPIKLVVQREKEKINNKETSNKRSIEGMFKSFMS